MTIDWNEASLDFDLFILLDGVRVGRRELEALKKLLTTGDLDLAASSSGLTVRELTEVMSVLQSRLGILNFEKLEELQQILEQKRVLVHGCVRGLRRPSVAVDMVVLREEQVLLVRRGRAPYMGYYALPGGFVEYGERVEEAAHRELSEETGVEAEIVELIGVYSDPERDPRGHTISVALLMKYREGEVRGGDDAREARFFPLERLPKLAFDHEAILRDGLLAAARRGMI